MHPRTFRLAAIALAISLTWACANRNETEPPVRPADSKDPVSQPQPPPKIESAQISPVIPGEIDEASRERAQAGRHMADAAASSPQLAYRQAGVAAEAIAPPPYFNRYVPLNTEQERYAHLDPNPVHRAAETPVSTFSIDVDTGAYANLRRFLTGGSLPPEDAVRVEELINYFDYAYAPPQGSHPTPPFALHTEMAPTPWNTKTHLLRIGIQGWTPPGDLAPSNLVFLVDVSGSMQDADKLPLVKNMLKLMLRSLRAEDRISMVVYAGSEGVVLEPTPGNERARIEGAIDALEAGGSTNGGAGIRRAYQLARQAFIKNGVNRILLCTDGDFNVGTTSFEELKDMVEREREDGIALTTLGFGEGNYNDQLMEQLADAGNGNHAYIDSLAEAHKVLVRNRAATLATIAKDVKIQIEFNPDTVAEYRLIGYENRMLAREDFNNDKVDAGEIGPGHSVTALYEIALVGSGGERVEGLRYAKPATGKTKGDELAFLRLRYKAPEGGASRLIERPVRRSEIHTAIAQASEGMRWAAAVSAFGQRLGGGKYLEGFGYDEIRRLADSARAHDPYGDRGEMLRLIGLAEAITPQAARELQPEPHG